MSGDSFLVYDFDECYLLCTNCGYAESYPEPDPDGEFRPPQDDPCPDCGCRAFIIAERDDR